MTETETWLNEFHKEGSQVPGQTSSEEDSLKNLAQSIMQKNRMKGATLRDVSASSWTDNLEPGPPGRCEVDSAKNSAIGSVQWMQNNSRRQLEIETVALMSHYETP